MVSITEVARRAGVSVSTVSHVVNGTRRVAPATRNAVQAVIDAVSYSPNALARGLKTSSTRSVGIALSAVSNPYFSDIVCAIEAACARLGMMVFLSDTEDNQARELEVVQALHQRRVDGLILAPCPDPERRSLDYIRRAGIPCVLVDRNPDTDFDQVGTDNRFAMHRLVDHVAGMGHRRIGYIGGSPGFQTTLERIEGYRQCLRDHKIAFNKQLIATGSGTSASATVAAHTLLALPEAPTVIVAGNNLATIGVMRAIRERNLKVPLDISVVGFDDFEWADFFEPRLTLMAQPSVRLGEQAAMLLMERIAQPNGQRRTIQLTTTLVERESCRRQ